MRKLRQSRAHLMTIVAVVIAAWLVASNHCALAALTSANESNDHACCHSEKDESPTHDVQCCNSLTVPTPENAVAPVVHLTELTPVWQPAPLSLLSDLHVEVVAVPISDTGPPGSESFAIIVLNRSLLAHAPPVFIV